jgi:hypothetical protein
MFGRKLFVARATVALLFAAGSVLVYALSMSLPAATLEPIGPATFPRIVAVILFVLSAATLLRSFERTPAAPSPAGKRIGLMLGALALLIVYIAVMDYGLVGFRPATIAFLFLLGIMMLGLKPGRVAAVAAIALAIGLGTHFVFTRFMYIDLPQ